MADNAINVEDIMKEIREDIEKSGAKKKPLSFISKNEAYAIGDSGNDDNVDKLHAANEYLSTHYQIVPFAPIEGNPVKVFIKRFTRKLNSFIVKPIVDQQDAINYHYWKVAEAIEVQRAQLEEMKATASDLEQRIAELEKEQKK